MSLDDLPDHEIERLYDAGLVSEGALDRIADSRLSPDDRALAEGIAYGIAKLFNTPLNQLVDEAFAHRAVCPKVSNAARTAYNVLPPGEAQMMSAHAGLDHVGADTLGRYRNVALHSVMGAQRQNPSPVFGYLRHGQQQHIYLFQTIGDGSAWFEQRVPGGFDYVAVFDAANLSAPIAEDLGGDNAPQVGCDPTQVGHWFLPLALGLPLGAVGGYAYRGWRERNPGKLLPWISGDPSVGAYPWSSIQDVGGPRFLQHGPWIDIVGAETAKMAHALPYVVDPAGEAHKAALVINDATRRSAWPRTKALIQSAIREVRDADATYPSAAYVWSLDAPGPSLSSHVELFGTTEVVPFTSHELALDFLRDRISEGGHVALALFDRASRHWPSPVNWTKSDDPAHEAVIAQQIARFAPARTAGVGSYPWHTIVGEALDVLRRQAKIAADEVSSRVIGVVRDSKNQWTIKQFRSSDAADDWFGRVTYEPSLFTYAAYFDKDDVLYPDPLNEKVGKAAARGITIGADLSGPSDVRSPTSTSTEVRSPTSTSTEVRSPTSTSTEVRSPTSTSTDAYTQGNVTVTGGAGDGATIVHIHAPHPDQPVRSDYESNLERSRGSAWRAERQMAATDAPRPVMPMPAIMEAANAPRPALPIPDMMRATDAPRATSPIPEMMHALNEAPSNGDADPIIGAWLSIIGADALVGTGPWGTIIGAAIGVIRRQAQAAAEELPARVIGVVRHGDNKWKLKSFRDADAADSWFGHVTREPSHFTYAAYFDKDDVMFPHPLNEAIGAAPAPSAPGATTLRVEI